MQYIDKDVDVPVEAQRQVQTIWETRTTVSRRSCWSWHDNTEQFVYYRPKAELTNGI